MTLNDYQNKAMTTCMESCKNFSYMFLNLVGEVGEFASKVAKAIRKKKVSIGSPESQQKTYPNELLFNAELLKALQSSESSLTNLRRKLEISSGNLLDCATLWDLHLKM